MDKDDRLLDDNYLPDNLPDCHKLIKDLRTRMKSLEERLAELEKQLARRNRMIFGKRSAKVSNTVLTGTGKAIYEANTKELEDECAELQILRPEKVHGGGGRTAPANAPVSETITHEITDPAELACPCCGTQRTVLGFRVAHQLDIIQAMFKMLKHVQYTYRCPKCQGEVITAPKPQQPFGKGYATGALVAHVANAKFNWHQPLYRQEEIYRAQSVPIARSTMCRLLKEGADIFHLIVKRMHRLILKSRFVQSDTTTMPVIKKGLGKTHKGAISILRGDENYPYIYYEYTDSATQQHALGLMPDYRGFLVTDGSQIYGPVIEAGATAVNCWSHAYRKFEDALKVEPEFAQEPIAMIKGLFDVERVAAEMPEEERLGLRLRVSKKRLAELKDWLDYQTYRADFTPKDAFGEAVLYLLNRWKALCEYADTGFLPADNNWSENGLRPAVLGRKNWLFAGSVDGGRTAAIFMSIVQTCRRLGIDPFEYMSDVLTRFPSARTSDVDQYLPDRWLEQRRSSH
jgi:transposase